MVGHPSYNGEFAQLESSIGGKANSPHLLDEMLTLKDSDVCGNCVCLDIPSHVYTLVCQNEPLAY